MNMLDMLDLLTLDDLPPKEKEMAELIGIEAYRSLVYYYGGTEPYIPQADKLIRPIRDKLIRREYNGENILSLAWKWGLTERYVRTIVQEKTKELNQKP